MKAKIIPNNQKRGRDRLRSSSNVVLTIQTRLARLAQTIKSASLMVFITRPNNITSVFLEFRRVHLCYPVPESPGIHQASFHPQKFEVQSSAPTYA